MKLSGYQIWSVPESGTYSITVQGAQGAGTSIYSNYTGGMGIIKQVNVTLKGKKHRMPGHKLVITVGQQGESYSARLGDK